MQDTSHERAARHQPDVERGLVDRERHGPRLLVVYGDERVGARRVERLAAARRDRPEEHHAQERGDHKTQYVEIADESHARGRDRPEDERAGDEPLAAEAVPAEPGDGRHDGKCRKERPVDPAHLPASQVELVLNRDRQQTEQRPVCLVEEEGEAQHRDQQPLVRLTHLLTSSTSKH